MEPKQTRFDERFASGLSFACMAAAIMVVALVAWKLSLIHGRAQIVFSFSKPSNLFPMDLSAFLALPRFVFVLVPAATIVACSGVQRKVKDRVVTSVFHLAIMVLSLVMLVYFRDAMFVDALSRMTAL